MKEKPEEHSILHTVKKNLFFYCFVLVLTVHLPLVFYKYTDALVSFTYDEINSNISRIKLIVKSIQAPSKKQKKLKELKAEKLVDQQPIEDDTSTFAQSAKGINDAEALYKNQLRRFINASRKYPNISRRRGHEGKLTYSFVIEKSGLIRDIKLLSASRYKLLNKAALKAIRKASEFKAFPSKLKKQYLEITQPFNFNLN